MYCRCISVARSDDMGNARASTRGTGNSTATHAFFVYAYIKAKLIVNLHGSSARGKKKSMTISKPIKFICLAFFTWAIALAVISQIAAFTDLIQGDYGYQTFQISDWMINYEGGFVRRGLIGQILWTIYQCHPYPIVYAIACIYYLSLAVFTLILSRTLIRSGVSLYILPFTICLFYGLGESVLGFRRDYLVLTITCCIFLCYNQYLTSRSKQSLLMIYILSILVLLAQESTFFFTFPILMLHTLAYEKKDKIKNLLILWIPAIITMGLVCIFKGTERTPALIWNSWMDCITTFPLGNNTGIGAGVAFLSNGLNVINSHFTTVWGGYKSTILNLYSFVAIYYLVTRINTINLNWYPLKPIDKISLSNILLAQWICLIPMYGFLSCDFGRVMTYWTLSSLLFYCALRGSHCQHLPYLSKISLAIQKRIDKIKALNNPIVYLFILISIPLAPYTGSTFFGCFRSIIPYDTLLSTWNLIRQFI